MAVSDPSLAVTWLLIDNSQLGARNLESCRKSGVDFQHNSQKNYIPKNSQKQQLSADLVGPDLIECRFVVECGSARSE